MIKQDSLGVRVKQNVSPKQRVYRLSESSSSQLLQRLINEIEGLARSFFFISQVIQMGVKTSYLRYHPGSLFRCTIANQMGHLRLAVINNAPHPRLCSFNGQHMCPREPLQNLQLGLNRRVVGLQRLPTKFVRIFFFKFAQISLYSV